MSSLLMAHAAVRLALAAVLLCGLWGAVVWALAGQP
jgi:hypothetical protein